PLDGTGKRVGPGAPITNNTARMLYRERRRYRIDDLPRDLHEALDYLEKDPIVREALGDHIYERYLDAKREEWQEYIGQVSEWELNRYLGQYGRGPARGVIDPEGGGGSAGRAAGCGR